MSNPGDLPDVQPEHRNVVNQLTLVLRGANGAQRYGSVLNPTAYISVEEFAEHAANVLRETIMKHYYGEGYDPTMNEEEN